MSSKFETLERIGKTPFGFRYRGFDLELNTEVAILELAEQYRANKDYAVDIWNTVSKLSRQKHDNLVQVLGVDKTEGWIVTEMRGASLADIVEKEPLPQNVVRTIMREVLDVLGFFEKNGLVHGDIRPEMLLLPYQSEGRPLDQLRVKLGFSLGLFLCGEVLQSGRDFKYIAPEVIMPQLGQIGPATDLYSLSFTALELLTGPKFNSFFWRETMGSQATAWARIHSSEDVRIPPLREMVPNLDDDLFQALDSTLKRNVAARPQSSGEILAMLKETKAESIPASILPVVHEEPKPVPQKAASTQMPKPKKQPTTAGGATPPKNSLPPPDSKPLIWEQIKSKLNNFEFSYTTLIFIVIGAVVVGYIGNILLFSKDAKKQKEVAVAPTEKTIPETPHEELNPIVSIAPPAKNELPPTLPLTKEPVSATGAGEPVEKTPVLPTSDPPISAPGINTAPANPSSETIEPKKTPEPPEVFSRKEEVLDKLDFLPFKELASASPNWKKPKDWDELEKMNQPFCLVGDGMIVDDDLTSLRDLKNLVALNLSQARKMTDAGLEYLKGQKQLEELELGSGRVTDRGMAVVAGLSELRKLSLSGCDSIGDEGVASLVGLRNLEFLLLPGSRITDKSLQLFSEMPSLHELRLWKSVELTDAGMVSLEKLKKLKCLDLSGCPKLTEKAAQKLLNILPSDLVFIFGEEPKRLIKDQ